MIQLYSTRNKDFRATLREAVLKGLPDDNGLFMPVNIRPLSGKILQNLNDFSFAEIAFEVTRSLFDGAIPDTDLQSIIDHTLTFDAPLVELDSRMYVLELFHGPTLAFKDFGARFMAQLMGYFVQNQAQKLYILVATSGDTGGAVANGFLDVPGIEVIILYTSGKVSELQEKQLTTLGRNIRALEIEGTFDDCQAIVKQAFLDQEVTGHLQLTSANSINIARLIPQTFYYFRALQQLHARQSGTPVTICVPSGNFGNLTAGLIARKMGLPISHFIAATNVNDVVPEYLHKGTFKPRPSVSTISNAMDVGNPSNFVRMLDLFKEDWQDMRRNISGFSYTDDETRMAIKEIFSRFQYTMDPHGAVGYLALREYQKTNNNPGIVLETAHPAKFPDEVMRATGSPVEIPERLLTLKDRTKKAIKLSKDYRETRDLLLGLEA